MFRLESKIFAITVVTIVLIECLSLVGHIFPMVNELVFMIIVFATLGLSLWRLEYGWWIVLAELVIGSFGYLFSYDAGTFHVSVRLGIFFVVFLAWLLYAVRKRRFTIRHTWFFTPLVLWLAMIVIGVINGALQGHPWQDIFFDMNGYLYLGLFPVAITVVNSWKRIYQTVSVLLAAVVAISVKTLLALFYFAHATDTHYIRTIYTWIRDTRVGEISPVVSSYYRIFFQGHLWIVVCLIGLGILLIVTKRRMPPLRQSIARFALLILLSTVYIVSFSRSLWLAGAATGLILIVWLVASKTLSLRRILVLAGIGALVLVVDIGVISGIVNVPLPGSSGSGVSATSLVTERVTDTDESAIGSRFQLLSPLVNEAFARPFFGTGFGTTVTYQSLDPRTAAVNGGAYTTYSFEWGYLDIITETGLVGMMVVLYFLWAILRRGVQLLPATRHGSGYYLILAVLFSLIMLIVVHATTPYINHPLGLGLIILSAATIYAIERELRFTNTSAGVDHLDRN